MIVEKLVSLLSDPNSNGILEFVLGFLFMLFTYHFLLYLQHRNRVYLYYTLYVGLILAGSLQFAQFGFVNELIDPIRDALIPFDVFFRWLYNSVYFLFTFNFIELAKYSKKWDRIMKYPIYALLVLGVIVQIISLVTGDNSYIHESFFLFFIPLIVIHSIIGYYVLFTIKTPLRVYIIVGSLFLFVSSVAGALIYYLEWLPKDNHLRDSIFYIGVIVENIFFSLGIGHKQRYLIIEKNRVILEEKERGLKAIIDAQERERSSIARDLHDGVVQQIGAISLMLTQAISTLPEKQGRQIVKAKELAETAAIETRLISHQMMSKALTDVGLVPAMEDVIEFVKGHDIDVVLDSYNLSNRYPDSLEIVVYRVFQELSNNIIKHAKANSVSVQLLENDKTLILIVEDNGVGMSEGMGKGIGLYNIDSRLTTVHGKVEFSRGHSGGTVATVVIPLVT